MEDNREVKEEQKVKDKKGENKLDTGIEAESTENETATGDKAGRTLLGKRAGKHDEQRADQKNMKLEEWSVVKVTQKPDKSIRWSNPLTQTCIFNVNSPPSRKKRKTKKKNKKNKQQDLKMIKQDPEADQKVQKIKSLSRAPNTSTNGNASPPTTPVMWRPWANPPNTPRGDIDVPLVKEEIKPLREKCLSKKKKKKSKKGKKKAKQNEKTDEAEKEDKDK